MKSKANMADDKNDRHGRILSMIVDIVEQNYGINHNKAIELASKKGVNHMAPLTAERAISELLNKGWIQSRRFRNKMCYYTPIYWKDEEQLQQELDRWVVDLSKHVEMIKNEFPAFNQDGKREVMLRLNDLRDRFPIISPAYYANVNPSEPTEDQIMKRIQKFSKKSSSKHIMELLTQAKMKSKEIKELTIKIDSLKNQVDVLPKENPKRYDLLHEKIGKWNDREKRLSELSDFEYSMEKFFEGKTKSVKSEFF